ARAHFAQRLKKRRDLGLGADGDAAPAVVRRKEAADEDVARAHEIGEAWERHAGVEKHEVTLRLRVTQLELRQLGSDARAAGEDALAAVAEEPAIVQAGARGSHREEVR